MMMASRAEGFGPEVKRRIMLGTFALSAGYADQYYNKALQVRRKIRGDFDAAFQEVDVLVGPTSPTPAFKLGERTADPLAMYLSDIYTITANLAGIPGISIPCGLTKACLPIGLQLLGAPFAEDNCCARPGYSSADRLAPEAAKGGIMPGGSKFAALGAVLADLELAAGERLQDAEVLFAAGRFPTAIAMGVYSLEIHPTQRPARRSFAMETRTTSSRRRGAHRRRVHRPGADRAPLQRRHAPGDRGQGDVEIKAENQTLATITLQNYFRLYEKLAGMTGTAQTEAAELHEIYKLGVVSIPTNKPMIRGRPVRPHLQDRGSQIHRGGRRRHRALREGPTGADRHHQRRALGVSVEAVHRSGASRTTCSTPSTTSRRRHHRRGGPTRRHHRRDQHGRPWYRHRARRQRRPSPTCGCARGLDPVETPDEYEAAWHEELPKVKEEAGDEADEVIEAGGL